MYVRQFSKKYLKIQINPVSNKIYYVHKSQKIKLVGRK